MLEGGPLLPSPVTHDSEADGQLKMLKSVLAEHIDDPDIFVLHQDRKSGKIVLSEKQFNLVKKVYTKCFINN